MHSEAPQPHGGACRASISADSVAESQDIAAAPSSSVQADIDTQIRNAQIVAEGRKPLAPTDSVKFNSLVRSAATVSKPALAGLDEPPAPFPTEFLPIDVAINNDPDFGLDSIAKAAAQFKFWQISGFFNRPTICLTAVPGSHGTDQLRSQWAKLFLEVSEFDQLTIHKREIEAGWYHAELRTEHAGGPFAETSHLDDQRFARLAGYLAGKQSGLQGRGAIGAKRVRRTAEASKSKGTDRRSGATQHDGECDFHANSQ